MSFVAVTTNRFDSLHRCDTMRCDEEAIFIQYRLQYSSFVFPSFFKLSVRKLKMTIDRGISSAAAVSRSERGAAEAST